MSTPNTAALREQLLLLLATEWPVDADLSRFVESLDDFELVAQIEIVETVQVETLRQLRALGAVRRIH